MEEDFEISVDELMLLKEPIEFQKYLYGLHQEIDIVDVDAFKELYSELGWWEHVGIVQEFEDIFDL